MTLCASTCLAQSARDRELASKLVGTWVVPPQQYQQSPAKNRGVRSVMKSATRTFRVDGTFKLSAALSIGGRDVLLHDQGKWKVENGVLILEITNCDQPQIVPVGAVTRDTLISVTDTEYRYRTEDGKERYRIRKRE